MKILLQGIAYFAIIQTYGAAALAFAVTFMTLFFCTFRAKDIITKLDSEMLTFSLIIMSAFSIKILLAYTTLMGANV